MLQQKLEALVALIGHAPTIEIQEAFHQKAWDDLLVLLLADRWSRLGVLDLVPNVVDLTRRLSAAKEPVLIDCPSCKGSGRRGEQIWDPPCLQCRGNRQLLRLDQDCPFCQGAKYIGDHPCPGCGGEGKALVVS